MSCDFCRDQEYKQKETGAMVLYRRKLKIANKEAIDIDICPLCKDKLKDADTSKALIKNNHAYCPVCMDRNLRKLNYRSVITSRGRATEMKMQCNDCGNEFSYMLIIRMDKNERFTEDRENIKEIAEEE